MSSAFHPQTDRQTERVNRTLEQILRNYIHPLHDDWDKWLPVVEAAYNDSVHSATGHSPFYVLNGCHPPTPIVVAVGADRQAVECHKNMLAARERVRLLIREAQERMRAKANPQPNGSGITNRRGTVQHYRVLS
jgi:hypothetical protein